MEICGPTNGFSNVVFAVCVVVADAGIAKRLRKHNAIAMPLGCCSRCSSLRKAAPLSVIGLARDDPSNPASRVFDVACTPRDQVHVGVANCLSRILFPQPTLAQAVAPPRSARATSFSGPSATNRAAMNRRGSVSRTFPYGCAGSREARLGSGRGRRNARHRREAPRKAAARVTGPPPCARRIKQRPDRKDFVKSASALM